jgi:hypothetical protein
MSRKRNERRVRNGDVVQAKRDAEKSFGIQHSMSLSLVSQFNMENVTMQVNEIVTLSCSFFFKLLLLSLYR